MIQHEAEGGTYGASHNGEGKIIIDVNGERVLLSNKDAVVFADNIFEAMKGARRYRFNQWWSAWEEGEDSSTRRVAMAAWDASAQEAEEM